MNISPSAVALNVANFKSQALGTLMRSNHDSGQAALSGLKDLFSAQGNSTIDPLAWITKSEGAAKVTAAGRNMALADPESAYRMMTTINHAEVAYKAEFSEMSQMKAHVAQMEEAGLNLGNIPLTAANDSIVARMQSFVNQYNGWIERFAPDMQDGGILDGTRAAEVSVYELEQSIENIFNGAMDGLHGLGDLGVSIDDETGLAALDVAKLESVLESNKQGAVNTLLEFSTNFAKSANLLISSGNFIPNRLDNLDRAIRYIDDNEASLRAEFGTGSMPQPTGQVAQALAAYNQTYAS